MKKPTKKKKKAKKAGPPPYKCQRTLDGCLKFKRNPVTGKYNMPAGGERVDCASCRYWFD